MSMPQSKHGLDPLAAVLRSRSVLHSSKLNACPGVLVFQVLHAGYQFNHVLPSRYVTEDWTTVNSTLPADRYICL